MNFAFLDDVGIPVSAALIAAGAVAVQPFGNIYALVARSDGQSLRRLNARAGRHPGCPGSVVTVWRHIPTVFDWSALPDGLESETVMEIIDTLLAQGPFGFRGPASQRMPAHLTSVAAGVRTARLIAPGYRCASNRLIEATLAVTGDRLLAVAATCAHAGAGAPDAAPHWRADTIAVAFADAPGMVLVRHPDEAATEGAHPQAAAAATVLGFHRLGRPDAQGRPTLLLERQGSYPVEALRKTLDAWGFGLDVTAARRRPTLRSHGEGAAAAA